jgi:pyridoxamine 5'-phosphate oxidase
LNTELTQVFDDCWHDLHATTTGSKKGYRNAVLATQGQKQIDQRIVVLRDVSTDAKTITFFTDARSAKMDVIKPGSNLSFLFYDAENWTQLRLSGNAVIHCCNEITQSYWQNIQNDGRRAYRAVPGPSTEVDHPTDGLQHLTNDVDSNDGYTLL